MTREEAIAMLKRIQEPEAWEPQINQAAFEALDMAIKALEQETVSRESYDHEFFLRKELEVKIAKLEKTIKALEKEPCADTISRQAAIDALQGRK